MRIERSSLSSRVRSPRLRWVGYQSNTPRVAWWNLATNPIVWKLVNVLNRSENSEQVKREGCTVEVADSPLSAAYTHAGGRRRQPEVELGTQTYFAAGVVRLSL